MKTNKLRFLLCEPFGGLRKDTVDELENVVKCFSVSFLAFIRENYHSDTEAWSFNKLPIGFYQDKITYDIISVEELFNMFVESYER